MGALTLQGATSGQVTLQPPSVAGTSTITIPAGTGTIAVPGVSSSILQNTSSATTSGVAIPYTAIPSFVKRITIILSGVSTSGTSNYQVQLGTGSTTYTTSGYAAAFSNFTASAVTTANATSGFVLLTPAASSEVHSGVITLYNLSGNIWVSQATISATSTTRNYISSGSITLGSNLTAVQLTTVNGTDTFNAGTLNVFYE